ncbi:MAG: hypothetical protein B7Z15_19165 [Rhizobiales bacterium 32-66-8]|nr:MAG: hypothetical protein B7Z15_19165 [Rhizobiales bacterium 32-66-8]
MEQDHPNAWDYCCNAALRRASRRISQLYDAALAPSGLRTTQYSLLSQIHLSAEPTLRALASGLVMDQSALGHTLKPLLRDGYVELIPDPNDRRTKRIRLTEAGRLKQTEATALWQDAQARFDAGFGLEASRALRLTLAHLASAEFAETMKPARAQATADPGARNM